jgi:NitT/TauT family transport system permease protein
MTVRSETRPSTQSPPAARPRRRRVGDGTRGLVATVVLLVLIGLVGINVWSVIVIGTVMAGIPMAVNTWVGLSGIRPVYLRLARSVGCGLLQTLFRVALPAAAPMTFAGLRLGTSYALIGAIAMEFTTAQAGLGYRIRYLYESFDTPQMYAYVAIVLVIAVLLTAVLEIAERVVATRSGR